MVWGWVLKGVLSHAIVGSIYQRCMGSRDVGADWGGWVLEREVCKIDSWLGTRQSRGLFQEIIGIVDLQWLKGWDDLV